MQLSNTEQLVSAINEMSTTAQDIAKNAVDVSDSTVNVNNVALQGKDA
ncbi:MAG: hypothetical protein GY951_05050, partial [Psychromonas sp.]|nr:hypothetical protein [Psychromonas sp.]